LIQVDAPRPARGTRLVGPADRWRGDSGHWQYRHDENEGADRATPSNTPRRKAHFAVPVTAFRCDRLGHDGSPPGPRPAHNCGWLPLNTDFIAARLYRPSIWSISMWRFLRILLNGTLHNRIGSVRFESPLRYFLSFCGRGNTRIEVLLNKPSKLQTSRVGCAQRELVNVSHATTVTTDVSVRRRRFHQHNWGD
jgi:hypothetical protein